MTHDLLVGESFVGGFLGRYAGGRLGGSGMGGGRKGLWVAAA